MTVNGNRHCKKPNGKIKRSVLPAEPRLHMLERIHHTVGRRTPARPRLQPRQILVRSVAALLLAGLLAGEGYLVAGFYRQQAYRHTMELWNCGGTVEANRRTPDPVYRETETPELPDSLFDNLMADEEAGDTIFTDNEPAEKATTGTDNVSQPEEVEALFD